MTNDMTNLHCVRCGANLALVGRMHNCSGALLVKGPPPVVPAPVKVVAPPAAEPKSSYRYRDPDKWRAYMRGYMAKRRAKQVTS